MLTTQPPSINPDKLDQEAKNILEQFRNIPLDSSVTVAPENISGIGQLIKAGLVCYPLCSSLSGAVLFPSLTGLSYDKSEIELTEKGRDLIKSLNERYDFQFQSGSYPVAMSWMRVCGGLKTPAQELETPLRAWI